MKFKIGDRVKCTYNDNGSSEYVGQYGVVCDIDLNNGPYYFGIKFDTVRYYDVHFSEDELEHVSSCTNYPPLMSIEHLDEAIGRIGTENQPERVNQIEQDLAKLK